MRYQSTVGLSTDEIAEIVGRIEEVLTSRHTGRPPLMSLAEQVEMLLLLLRRNLSPDRARGPVPGQPADRLPGLPAPRSQPVPTAPCSPSPTPSPAPRHDRKAISECGWEPLLDTTVWTADPGYQGTTATTPTRKPKNDELTDYQKTVNKPISGRKSAVERAIAHLKNWKILATGYRGRLAELPNIIRIVARLEFYRLGW